ncbi:polyprenyl synthetase family protein [Tabrizicola sp.]|uniref:polyprenyl synthetase family protein n=1 Tax=Tabrizicola sp. TaxID=2005166 RepID=UPI003F3E22B8
MPFDERIEQALYAALGPLGQKDAPPRLSAAIPYAVFPGGARIRPTILLAVASACGDDRPEVSTAAAVALEFIHCASLVHDDLPAFDNADLRRGKPSLHRAFSEPLAVLAGDSLIVMAFEVLSSAGRAAPDRALALTGCLARHTGAPHGICAGQAWESEPRIDLAAYHRAKTAALFVAATQMGALAAGQEAEPWHDLGARIGEAFQVADDLKDALLTPDQTGKPSGQDAAHLRPSAVQTMGVEGAMAYMKDILGGAIASIPSCPGEAMLAKLVQAYAHKITMVPVAANRDVA